MTTNGNIGAATGADDGNDLPMNLEEFIEKFRDSITEQIVDHYAPEYSPSEDAREWPKLLRTPLGAQANAVRGAALSLTRRRGTTVVGEMGTGKTYIAIAAAHMAGMRRVVVLCPGHLVKKWRREVVETVPNATAVQVKTVTDMERLRDVDVSEGPLFAIMGNSASKLGPKVKPAFVTRRRRRRVLDAWGDDTGETEVVEQTLCPSCYAPILDERGEIIPASRLASGKKSCVECGQPLWQYSRGSAKRPKVALSEYVKMRMPRFFDLFIADEAHEYKARNSAQGIAAGVLAERSRRTLSLTGTLMGGYSSTLFYMLYRLSMNIRDEFGHNDESRWIDRYGFRERIIQHPDDGDVEYGSQSRRKKTRERKVERPGIAPAALFQILPGTVFLRLADVADRLPEYREEVVSYDLDAEVDETTGYSQRSAYRELADEMLDALKAALKRGSAHLLGAYLQSLLSFPDGCVQGARAWDNTGEEPELIVEIPPLPADRLYPKEEALLDLVEAEKARGRRTLVYVTHTRTRDITPRLEKAFESRGLKAVALKSDTVAPQNREDWVSKQVEDGVDALICHPKLVQTGLDLVQFPTIAWYETEYSVYTMRQASRRSWRIGQDQPVRVVYMTYAATLQEQALRLVAKKMASSLAIEGDLPDEGLATLGDDGDNLFMELARSIVSGKPIEGSLDDLFANARAEQSDGDGLLVEGEGWDFEPEPKPEIAAALPESAGGAPVQVVDISGIPVALEPLPTRSGLLADCPSCGVTQFPFGFSDAPFPDPPAASTIVACAGCGDRMLVQGTDPDAPVVDMAPVPDPEPVVEPAAEVSQPADPESVIAIEEWARHFEEVEKNWRTLNGGVAEQGNLFSSLLS